MIIVQVAGGLGNQMQQYAMYRKFQKLGKTVKLDLSWFREENQKGIRAKRELELKWFEGLPMEECTEAELHSLKGGNSFMSRALIKTGLTKSHEYAEDLGRMYCEDVFRLEDAYVTGYYACNKYYEDVIPELRKLFVFPEAESKEAREKNEAFATGIKEEEEEGITSVSLHFRRGDYLETGNSEVLGGISTKDYYEGAVGALSELIPGQENTFHFYLFSDDPEYARTLRFGGKRDRMTVVDWNRGKDSMLDMKLMSLCRVNITANSSFSIWGGRLNGREDAVKIRPSIHRNTLRISPEEMHSYWDGWTLISPEGKLV